MTKIRIREMTAEDTAGAAALEQVCFSQPWTAGAFLDSLAAGYSFYFLAEEQSPKEQRVVGLCGCREVAGEGEISNVSVYPEYRRQGIGADLLQAVLAEGERRGITAFTLEVRCSNRAAIGLYESFGFEAEGCRKGFYDKPKEDGLIMWKRQEV